MGDKRLYGEGRPEGDYAVRRPNSERASAVARTQAKVIERAKQMEPKAAVHVERQRRTSQGNRDKWRRDGSTRPPSGRGLDVAPAQPPCL